MKRLHPLEDGLRGALRDDAVAALGGAHDDRHDPSLKIERDFVDLGQLWDASVRGALFVSEDRAIEHALEAGLEVGVRVGERQHFVTFAQRDIAMLLENDFVPGQRAGLVDAQHVHRPQVLDGVDALDDDLLFAHRQRTPSRGRW